jgi:hypothetical protein
MNPLFWKTRVEELGRICGSGRNSVRSLKPIDRAKGAGLIHELKDLAHLSRRVDASVILLLIAGLIVFMVHPISAQSPSFQAGKAEDIRDIKGIISLAGLEWWIYAGGVLALIGLGLLIYLLKRKKPIEVVVESPEGRAFREMEEARAYLQEGMAREFSLRVSEVLRRYLEERFHVPVVQRTTEEFLQELRKSRLVGVVSHKEELNVFFSLCDQAKFGREPLTLTEMEAMWSSARSFVEQSGITAALGNKPLAETRNDALVEAGSV